MADSSSTQAVEQLARYYEAMNRHDVDAAIAFLASDVEVTFPEAERNWRSKAVAHGKFAGMFERMPGFRGEFTVKAVTGVAVPAGHAPIVMIKAHCRFHTAVAGQPETLSSERTMVYTMSPPQGITRIEHL